MLSTQAKFTNVAVKVFTTVVILNELVLMLQGLGIMFKQNSLIYPWLLWFIGIGLFLSSSMIAIASVKLKSIE